MTCAIAACSVRGDAQSDDKALKAALSQWLPQPPRRIDRLILLALLCSARLKAHIQGNCGLYLASAHPARATMGALLDAVCVHQRQPKPFEFVNSVSNAAGFHVAAQLNLHGPNLFIGAGRNAWAQLQQLASLDLAAGVIEQALLVVIEDRGEFLAQAALIDSPTQAADFSALTAAIEPLQIQLG